MILDSFTRHPARWALGCGLSAAALLACYLRVRLDAVARLGRPIPVVIAERPLAPQTVLAPDMLRLAAIPRQFVPPGAVTRLEDAVGRVARAPILPGEIVAQHRIARAGAGTGAAALIPPRTRGISVAVDAVSGVSGLIEPGNLVDLVATFDFGQREQAQS
ncbi:MAG: Flp pilus assembly protein CpaB, partial [Deltaproteobacteria bacterium]|nr:Flp pilus assembly protein CpaB [Deltaproteobacteria bacterium]